MPRSLPSDRGAGRLRPLSVVAVERYRSRSSAAPAAQEAPDFQGRQAWIDFREPPSAFPSFSYADVLRPVEGRMRDVMTGASVPASVFADRIVFVGRDEGEPSRADRFPLPNTLGRLYPGVYGHAYATEMLLRGTRMTRVSPLTDGAAALAVLGLLLAIIEMPGRRLRTLLIAALPLASFLACLALLAGPGIWLGSAPMFVAFSAALLVHWALVRMSLAASLSRAVGFDPRLIEAFRRESARQAGPVRKQVAILIADVRDYTRYVSRTEPGTVSAVMSEYMHAMERCITAEGGYINKYVGDEISAVFGFPLAAAHAARRAVRAALVMREELGRRSVAWKERGLAAIERIGIGIDTGTVSFAEVGGRTRSQFDIIGDCINGASRIEHLTKELGRSLLLSEEVYASLESEDSLAGIFDLAKTVAVRGQGTRRIFALAGEHLARQAGGSAVG